MESCCQSEKTVTNKHNIKQPLYTARNWSFENGDKQDICLSIDLSVLQPMFIPWVQTTSRCLSHSYSKVFQRTSLCHFFTQRASLVLQLSSEIFRACDNGNRTSFLQLLISRRFQKKGGPRGKATRFVK